jgi:predicted Zn-ribbon and HTH transcriptional regulator
VVYGRGFDVRLACECDCGHAFLLHPAQVSRGAKCPECHGEVK